MDITAYRKQAGDMIALVRCAVNGETPDAALTAQLDLPALFEVCQAHYLTACAAYALESAGIRDSAFTEAKEKAIRKNILLDAERKKVLKRLEEAQIWYMPLKGAVMKDWYPRIGMRQMSDNDILFDAQRRADVRKIMEELGFTCEHYGRAHDDCYYKPPVCNFEMHVELFSDLHAGKHAYYDHIRERLLPDAAGTYGCRFRDEDFYIYVLVHEHKHYTHSGTGLRSLTDIYIMLRKFGDSLDRTYLAQELEKLGLTEFEQQSRTLAEKVFGSGAPLTDEETEMLDYFITSGVYGSQERRTENDLRKIQGSKAKYLFRRLFPSMERIKVLYPFFYRHKWLIPVLWIWRPIHVLLHSRRRVMKEIRALIRQ